MNVKMDAECIDVSSDGIKEKLTYHLPIALTDFLTKSTSTSVAYSFNSDNTWAMFLGEASLRSQNKLVKLLKSYSITYIQGAKVARSK